MLSRGVMLRQEERERLVRIETKIDQMMVSIGDHETRIRNNELKINAPLRVYAVPLTMLGAAGATVAALVSVLR
jgi:hypothetical protein